MRKTEETAAYYEIIEPEADVVRKVFNWYTVGGLSIGTIIHQMTELGETKGPLGTFCNLGDIA